MFDLNKLAPFDNWGMCSPSSIYQLLSTWADIAVADGLSTGIQGGVWSLLGMCAPQIQVVAALTVAVCGVSLVVLHRHKADDYHRL